MPGNQSSLVERLCAERLVAIFRGDYRGKWLNYVDALLEGGISLVEITLNSPGALEGMDELRRAMGERIVLGAGTVLSPEQADAAIDAGAQFIVAPDTDRTVINVCKARGTAVIPGAYTSTEIKQAYLLGADMVKLFPAQTPEYVGLIHAPLDHIPLMVTGGVTVANAHLYIRKGARAVGVGTYLTSLELNLAEVTARAVRLRAALEQA